MTQTRSCATNSGAENHRDVPITISTAPGNPFFGGGTDNIAFLWGNAAASEAPIRPARTPKQQG